MVLPRVVSLEFALWSQLLFLWSFAAYGVAADPLRAEAATFGWKVWLAQWSARCVGVAILTYFFSRSIVLSCSLLLVALLQPLLRYQLPMQWLAEFEVLCLFGYMLFSLALIRYFHAGASWAPIALSSAQLAGLCIIGSTLFVVVRGGTYVVRGILRKSGTVVLKPRLHPVSDRSASENNRTSQGKVDIAASAEEPGSTTTIDAQEYNRGRLIGNLERIVLTIVVAAGSYAALAFLVAAKSVVRSDEFGRSRDFTEYFLIGSLSSVLVALFAGMALRFALIRLWPDLLILQLQ